MGNAEILNWLWGIVILAGFLFWAIKRKQSVLRRFADKDIIKEIANSCSQRVEIIRSVLIICVFCLSIIALARPQWGFEWQEIKRKGLDILIVVDTSKSMLTKDVRPDRLGRTKLAVKDLLKKLKGDRIGLIAFAGDAFLVCPLTVDYGGFLLSLEDLNTKSIPRGGTNLSSAIKEAIKEYDNTPSKYKAVIIATDGENLEGDPILWAKKAKEKGIKIYCVGIGTKEGELIQVEDALGKKEFLKDEKGNFVKSRLNEQLLQKIALSTEGVYVRASGVQFGLDLIYEKELSKLEKRKIESKIEQKYFERFQWPLTFALLLLILETCLPMRRRERKV
jgi:Ca-activated chloride channel family protein